MPTTLKKPKAKSQARIYERIENIEQAATKEFVRQELRAELEPIQRDIKWLSWVIVALLMVMLGGFALLLTVMLYLHSDTKADMKELKADIDKRFEKMETEQKEQRKLLLQILQKR